MKGTRIVVVVNAHFIPTRVDDAFPFGVIGFLQSTLQELKSRGYLVSLLLYERDDRGRYPTLEKRCVFALEAVIFRFNFSMSLDSLQEEFRKALALAIDEAPRGKMRRDENPVVVYHQTPTLLHLQPETFPFLVTHHGPIVSEVIREFGRPFALQAFDGGSEKLLHLEEFQRRGLTVLNSSSLGMALEISTVQRDALLKYGIAAEKIVLAQPPFRHQSVEPDHSPGMLRSGPPSVLRIISATARVDQFKNLEEIIGALNILHSLGYPVHLHLYVGDAGEQAARDRLNAMLIPDLRPRARIVSRLPHPHLMELLRQDTHSTIFVCSSRYETFGITPLEAALSRMVTIVPDRLSTVGIARLMPQAHRYHPGPTGLAVAIGALFQAGDLERNGIVLQGRILTTLSDNSFVDSFEECVNRLLRQERQ